jgi:(methylthio)acryloyl-CoA hydratase
MPEIPSPSELIKLSIIDSTLLVGLNRPDKRNAFNDALI